MPVFMNNIVEFFDRVFDVLFGLTGIVIAIVALGIGGFCGTWIRTIIHGIGTAIPIYLNRVPVDLILRLIVIVLAVVLCFSVGIPFADVLDSVLPVGDFDEMAENFAGSQGDWLVGTTISAGWNQMLMAMISFLPYFLITEIILLLKSILCSPEEPSWYGYVSFIPELLTLMASNVVLILFGDVIPWLLLDFIRSIDVQYGLLRFLLLALLLFIYLFYVLSDMLGSDLFLSMMGANIAAVILGADLTGQLRITILLLSIGLGYISKLGRNILWRRTSGGEMADNSGLWSVIYGLPAMALLTLIFLGVLKLMGC